MIHGFDNVILACGPHCSGKTFNITGWNRKCEGIAQRLIEDMLASQTGGVGAYAMSCVEIKDNRVFDLLNDDDGSASRPRPCLTKDVCRRDVDSAETARRMLREANAKRTTVAAAAAAPAVHVCDFVITFYYRADGGAEQKRAKVHVVELAGVGPHAAKPLKYQIQTNRTVLDLIQFLEHVVANVKGRRRHPTTRYHGRPSSALLRYCQGSFAKQSTTLRLVCHIRPESEFLDANVSILKLAEAFRKLPSTVISLPVSLTAERTELHLRMEHLKHEMRLCCNLKGHRSMSDMTDAHYQRLRDEVLNFLQSKTEVIVLPGWSYADVFVVLSVFGEYLKSVYASSSPKSDKNHENSANLFEYARFPLTNPAVDKDAANTTVETTRQTVNETLHTTTPLGSSDVTRTAKQKYWEAFVAENPTVISERENMSAEVRDAHRSFETDSRNVLDVQEKLTRMRDRLDKLRRERQLGGNEQYDGNMNVIVPDAEKCAFQNVRRVDAEMTRASEDLARAQARLDRAVAELVEINGAVNERFESESFDFPRAAVFRTRRYSPPSHILDE